MEKLSVTVFSDAGRLSERVQLCCIAGLLIDPLKLGSPFYVLSWSSRRSKRYVRSTGEAEILAAGEAIDEVKALADSIRSLLGRAVPFMSCSIRLIYLHRFSLNDSQSTSPSAWM